jgi:hypothetical protein
MRERDCLEDSPAGVGDGHRGIVRRRPSPNQSLTVYAGHRTAVTLTFSPKMNLHQLLDLSLRLRRRCGLPLPCSPAHRLHHGLDNWLGYAHREFGMTSAKSSASLDKKK